MDQKEMINKIRAAIKDRATWFALLYRGFKETLPEQEVERLARQAIFEFGRLKAKNDPPNFSPAAWVERHVAKGSALVFDSDVEINDRGAVQRMKYCALVEAWKEMGCSAEEIALFCDIAMEGDRGRAAAHGVRMELEERIARGDPFCHLKIFPGP
ncbi:MAG: L-2-amino-thiazoline-4-carboxylic acid hydrolase [Thermodesulfobacteriota bacterium]